MSDRYKGAILSPTAPTVTPQSAGGIYTSSQQLQYQGQGVWPQAVNNPINNSLRFRASASAYLNRTPASAATSRRIMTYSAWVKLGILGTQRLLYEGYTSVSDFEGLVFNTSNQLEWTAQINGGTSYGVRTPALFRDPSAWYHIVCAVDTTQATDTNRVKIYVNGVQQTGLTTFYSGFPAQNTDLEWNNQSSTQVIGWGGHFGYYDGYMAEINMIDGSALTPSSFGTTDAYGIWQPIPYTGAYGTNGFYLPFTDNSALTTSSNVGLGKDFSGNGNYWVTNNISITAGSTYDSMKDVPTNTNSNTANYCTLNPTVPKTYCTQTDGNLKSAGTSSTDSDTSVATIGVSSGKWYWEDKIGTINSAVYPILGAGRNILSSFIGKYPGDSSVGGLGIVVGNGNIVREGSTVTTVTALVANDVVGFALDLGALTCAIYKNNSLIYTVTGLTAGTYYPMANEYSSSNSTHNYGQQPFTYTPPTGFLPLNTYNLPTPTILAGNQYMDATTYTGDGSQTASFTNSGSMQPDLVWSKIRSGTTQGIGVFDSLRGTTGQALDTAATTAEGTWNGALSSEYGYVSAFNSNGFSVNDGSVATTGGYVNFSGRTYVAWQWRASNAAGVSNTQGTITSTVSANTTAGFSIVTYSGNGTSGETVGHGLGVTPSMVIFKGRNASTASSNWLTWHRSISQAVQTSTTIGLTGFTGAVYLNLTNASSTYGLDPQINGSGGTYVAYCFAQVAGYSAFGSFTGNGSSDNAFIYTGFRPRFIMWKRSDGVNAWGMVDTARATGNVVGPYLLANASDAEGTADLTDILSNGFKMRNGAFGSGETYIYMAFAENPFKISRAR